jgi:thioredoxin 1
MAAFAGRKVKATTVQNKPAARRAQGGRGGCLLTWVLYNGYVMTDIEPNRETGSMASENVVTVTSENWEQEVVKSDIPVLVDFWAVWCAPCRALAPTIDKIADQFVGKVKVAKLNTEDAPDIAAKYRINAIPQLLVFKGSDEPIARPSAGGKSEADIVKMLNQAMGG